MNPYWRWRLSHPSCWWRLTFGRIGVRLLWRQQGSSLRFPVVLHPGWLRSNDNGGTVIGCWHFDLRYCKCLDLRSPEQCEDFVAHLARCFPESDQRDEAMR